MRHLATPDELFILWEMCSSPHPIWEFCEKCKTVPRGYRILVDWMRFGLFYSEWEDELPSGYRERYESVLRETSSRDKVFTQECIFPAGDDERSFFRWLLLAWLLMQLDNKRAVEHPSILALLREMRFEPSQYGDVLDTSFVPVDVLTDIPLIRRSLRLERQGVNSSRQSSRQRERRGENAIVQDLAGDETEVPPSPEWERWWAAQYGMEKETSASSRQLIWTMLFVPLSVRLRPYAVRRKQDGWKANSDNERSILPDDLFKKVSRLIHLRYPDLWSDEYQRVRDRCTPFLR